MEEPGRWSRDAAPETAAETISTETGRSTSGALGTWKQTTGLVRLLCLGGGGAYLVGAKKKWGAKAWGKFVDRHSKVVSHPSMRYRSSVKCLVLLRDGPLPITHYLYIFIYYIHTYIYILYMFIQG